MMHTICDCQANGGPATPGSFSSHVPLLAVRIRLIIATYAGVWSVLDTPSLPCTCSGLPCKCRQAATCHGDWSMLESSTLPQLSGRFWPCFVAHPLSWAEADHPSSDPWLQEPASTAQHAPVVVYGARTMQP